MAGGIVITCFLVFFSPAPIVPFILLGASLGACLVWPRTAIMVYTLFCLAFIGVILVFKFPVSGFNLYLPELAILLGLALFARPQPLRSLRWDRLGIILTIYSVYGLIPFLFGFAFHGYAFRDAAGAFISYFLVPLLFYFLTRSLLNGRKDELDRMVSLLPLVALPVLIMETIRIVTGITWGTWRYENIAFRAIAPIEGAALVVLFSYFLLKLLDKATTGRWRYYIGLLVFFSAMILSNFRMLWFGIVFAMAIVFILHAVSGGRIRESWKTLLGTVLALTLAIAFVFILPLRPAQDPYIRFGLRVVGFNSAQKQTELIKDLRSTIPPKKLSRELKDVSLASRWRNWAKAIDVWASSPIIGTGLGYKHTFTTLGSNLEPITVQRTVHNDYLQILMHTGIVGGGLFITFHLLFVLRVLRRLRYLGSRVYTAIPLFSAYLFACYLAVFTPIFTVRPTSVVIYSLMAIISLLTEDVRSSQEKAEVVSTPGAPPDA